MTATAAGRIFSSNFETSAALMQALVDLPQPVIAAVQGMATAAGCQLVAACDLIVASEAARFCTPGVDIGLFCAIPAVPLSRKVAPGHALEMLLTGEPIGAERAREIGLVNRVVPLGREREEAIALAHVSSRPNRPMFRGSARRASISSASCPSLKPSS